MLDFQTIAAIIFVVILTLVLFLNRKKLETTFLVPYLIYFSMYKTKLGLNLMDSLSKKFRRTTIYLGYFGIFIGFLGMIAISYGLISNIFAFFTKPGAATGVGLVLPIKGKGIFYVPFFYWIISIFVIAVVHEFSHGWIARAHNIKVKSSGFAFLGGGFRLVGLVSIIISLFIKTKNNLIFDFNSNFLDYSKPEFWIIIGIILLASSYIKKISELNGIPIIPAAFVEPDEKALRKRPHSQQLSVFAAGPLANIITGFIFLLLAIFMLTPIITAAIEPNGVKVTDFVKGNATYPAESSGIKIGETIQQIGSTQTPYVENLSQILRSKKPGDVVTLTTDKSFYQVKLAKNPENESSAYIGAYLEQSTKIKESVQSKYGEFLPNAGLWFYGLFITLFILNLGIGLFNLVPLGPLDGGRMLQLPLQKYFGEENGKKIWVYIGLIFLAIIIINVGAGFGLFNFLK
ncbi:MAG TPA: site-2 protease family protein [Candidatus Nanoarchaeia archaeon]|nr:site-2 protease family protein [Candidatus Nanoarchaeia archaeon]